MDHMRFAVSWQGRQLPGARPLVPAEAPRGTWPKLVMAALASGAFPGGLAPRLLDRERGDYAGRHGRAPLWNETGPALEFLCVDGGLMDNEPLELARKHLANADRANPRPGYEAHRAVVMIDPFPNEPAFSEKYEPDAGLISVGARMFGALKNQARFKPEELDLAEKDDVFSRFMIAPSRKGATGSPGTPPAMASAILGGFGGFFHESFRRHDFQLGRRNCQAFLKWHFCLPVTNAVFAGVDGAVLDDWKVRETDGSVEMFTMPDGRQVPYAPIIPLVGAAAEEVKPLPLPSGKAVDRDALEAMVQKRIKAVGQAMIKSELSAIVGGAGRFAIEKAWNWNYASKVTKKAMDKIAEGLDQLP